MIGFLFLHSLNSGVANSKLSMCTSSANARGPLLSQTKYVLAYSPGLAVCNILHYGWHRPLYSEPIQHTHHIIATLQCTGSNHVTADICNPSRSHVLGGQHWTQAKKHTFLGAQGSWLLAPIPPAIQANQKTHLSWCPSCQHWIRAATQADKRTIRGASTSWQQQHKTDPVLALMVNYPDSGANWLSGSKIPVDEVTDSPAFVEAIEFKMTLYF
ncbi:hypothetical protein FXO38_12671, partial [Capsicum annuum]